jgi:PIN domain nuclease of toxin-antitoxin system
VGQEASEAESGNSPSVLDSSAVLAVLFDEDGAENVMPHLATGCISAVNVVEVVTTAMKEGASYVVVRDFLTRLALEVIPFDVRQALAAGSLQPFAKPHNLSLGDRACLALGFTLGRSVVTADREWANVPNLKVAVTLIR